MQEYGLWINVGTAATVILFIAGVVRKFSLMEAATNSEKEDREVMEARIENVTRDVLRIERDGITRVDILRQETGEMGAALRQKIHEVEMSSRDRIDEVAAGIRESIERLGDRLEGKIDKAMQRRDG